MGNIERLAGTISVELLIAAVVLGVLFAFFAGILVWAQIRKGSTFDVGNFLRDDQGKESSGRAFGFIALAVHCWWVVTLVFQKEATIDHFLWFGIIWAGTPVITILAHRWGGNLPFSQNGSPPTLPPPGGYTGPDNR